MWQLANCTQRDRTSEVEKRSVSILASTVLCCTSICDRNHHQAKQIHLHSEIEVSPLRGRGSRKEEQPAEAEQQTRVELATTNKTGRRSLSRDITCVAQFIPSTDWFINHQRGIYHKSATTKYKDNWIWPSIGKINQRSLSRLDGSIYYVEASTLACLI